MRSRTPELLWSFSRSLHRRGWPRFAGLVKITNWAVYKCLLPTEAIVGGDIVLEHYALGFVMHPQVTIGDHCRIYHQVTLASESAIGSEHRILLGDHVVIGAHSVMVGRSKEKACAARDALNLHPDCDTVIYADPGVLFLAPWAFFGDWISQGVAFCLDSHFPYLPSSHPWRETWRRLLHDATGLPGRTLSHDIGHPKAWERNFLLEALQGFPPLRGSSLFLDHCHGPIKVFSPAALRAKKISLRVAQLIARAWKR